jgi:hypothetical protein
VRRRVPEARRDRGGRARVARLAQRLDRVRDVVPLHAREPLAEREHDLRAAELPQREERGAPHRPDSVVGEREQPRERAAVPEAARRARRGAPRRRG